MPKLLTALSLLALAAAGCGSGSSPSTSTSSSTSTPQAGASVPSTQTTTQPGAQSGSGQGGQAGSSGGSGSAGADNSIQTYGSSAPSALKGSLAATAFSFFRAMAASDYAKVCAGLAASNRKGLEAFLKAKHQRGGCPAILKTLISTRGVPEARKAAAGKLTSVRVKGDTAFVLFQPKGGPPSYFVMKRERGAWKAISLAPGTPLALPPPPGH